MTRTTKMTASGFLLLASVFAGSRLEGWSAEPSQARTFEVVVPGTHPGIVFSARELPRLRQRASGTGLAAEAYRRIRGIAQTESGTSLTVEVAVGREGERLSRQLEAMALVYQIEGDTAVGRQAVELFDRVAAGLDPWEFYRTVDSDFFATEHWPKAFAFAWDWLFPLLTPMERQRILGGLEKWCAALYGHTESWWWREAGYNCGAIPVGAQGMLLASIQGETNHPDFNLWLTNCFRKIRENYFPLTWRSSGICNEGPGYAHYHKNPTQFFEAIRRTGGPDLISETGAVNAMHYLRHQWMPQGGCGPIGDNTEYDRRVFQSIYLHGIRELGDRAGLWTFERYTDFERINPILIFLFYPDELQPVSPGNLDLRTSHYFEIDRNRAGTVFARSEWDSEESAWFAFVTRFANANHTHYDMNTFLFSAFGEQLAAHANVYPYSHPDHGVDFEHNIVIIDDGGMPAADRRNSAGDDGSINGFLTGLALGHFADYARGDARLSYADRSIPGSAPARRADRSVLFAKQGPNPYLVVTDDIRKDEAPHDYHWQWYTPALQISGAGTLGDPLFFEGDQASCQIVLLDSLQPMCDFEVVKGGHARRPIELGRIRVTQQGEEAHFFAVATAARKGSAQPRVVRGPQVQGPSRATSLIVEGAGFRDLLVWQPPDEGDRFLVCGSLKTDALLALVRTDLSGRVVAYLMGEGTSLEFGGQRLADSEGSLSLSVDTKRAVASGQRRSREGLAPLSASGYFWLPERTAEVWADEQPLGTRADDRGMVRLDRSAVK